MNIENKTVRMISKKNKMDRWMDYDTDVLE